MTVRLVARHRGPLVVEHEGPIEIVGTDGTRRDLEGARRVLICRCGASSTAPLCDGSHNGTRFEAPDDDAV